MVNKMHIDMSRAFAKDVKSELSRSWNLLAVAHLLVNHSDPVSCYRVFPDGLDEIFVAQIQPADKPEDRGYSVRYPLTPNQTPQEQVKLSREEYILFFHEVSKVVDPQYLVDQVTESNKSRKPLRILIESELQHEILSGLLAQLPQGIKRKPTQADS